MRAFFGVVFFFLFVDIFGRLMSGWKASLTENLLDHEVSVGRPGRLQPRRNSVGRRSVWRKVLEDRLEILCP